MHQRLVRPERVEVENRNILQLSNEEARAFLLKDKSYCTFDLPYYFNFQPIMDSVEAFVGDRSIIDVQNKYYTVEDRRQKRLNPFDYEDVNYSLLNNKDGKLSWRPYQLIHPVLYFGLVKKITEQDNWNIILQRFEEFNGNPKINCLSMPIISGSEESDQAESVSTWWEEFEQKSIELALEYDYLLQTDITDCYGSIYTHSISWSLHGKEEAKEKRKRNQLLGNFIDGSISDMAYGQTNGIPQGSVLMNFVAEMVLGYGDLLLSERLTEVEDYCILRYRDDYRIFTNNPQDAELIAKKLSEVLTGLNLKLNNQKTSLSNHVVRDSIKPDKYYWIKNRRIPMDYQKYLFSIYSLAEEFPNSGSLNKELKYFFDKITALEEYTENVKVLISVIVDVALKNPRTYPVSSAILSKLLTFLPVEEKSDIIEKMRTKFSRIPNTGLLQLWLQRITQPIDPNIQYQEPLTRLVRGERVIVWNSDWLDVGLQEILESTSVLNPSLLEELSSIVESVEIELYHFDS